MEDKTWQENTYTWILLLDAFTSASGAMQGMQQEDVYYTAVVRVGQVQAYCSFHLSSSCFGWSTHYFSCSGEDRKDVWMVA